MAWGHEEFRVRVAPEMVAQNMKGANGIAEIAGHISRRATLDKVGSQGLVHAVLGAAGFEEEAATLT